VASGGLAGEIAKLIAQPMPSAARTAVFASAGLEALTTQLEAAKIVTDGPNAQLLEQALFRALELIAPEDAS
jgi:hypothetical protein